MFIKLKENFLTIAFYLGVHSVLNKRQNIYILLHIKKTLLHTLLLLVCKIVEIPSGYP